MTGSHCPDKAGVIVTSGISANTLGVIRCFGRRGIPVTYIDSKQNCMSRYSRYIHRRLRCPRPSESEPEFINTLINFGKQLDGKMVLIPTNDEHLLTIAKHKRELEQYYLPVVPEFDLAQIMINKGLFYKFLAAMKIPHPKTYFPKNIIDLWLMGKEIDYPYIIKPADSSAFQEEFGRKCFLISSSQELKRAVDKLRGKSFEVMVQEIVPGEETYEFYTYLNKQSEPLGICGWDRIRQYPPGFGTGSFCKSSHRLSAVEPVIRLLQEIRYSGFAAPDQKIDPRDGKYKLLEINARTTLQNRLAAACGVDIEYIAYLDVTGQRIQDIVSPRNNIYWIDDFYDHATCFLYVKHKKYTFREVFKSFQAGKLHSVAAWDDPIPLFALAINLFLGMLNKIPRAIRNRMART